MALLRWGGLALLCVSLAYLIRALAKLDFARLVDALGWHEWVWAVALTGAYAASLGLLAKAWLAVAAPGRRLSLVQVVSVYGPGAVAKYLPGSVFQYASRHIIGKRAGMEHGVMVRASIAEAALHVCIAVAFAVAFLAGAGIWAAGVVCVAGVALVLLPLRPLIASFAWQLIFFATFAAIVIVLGTFGTLASDPARLAGYFFLAWVAGFLVPIAPGGIGVREAVLLAIATPVEDLNAVALLALLTRLVGIFGDGLFGLAGYLALWRANRQAFG